MRVERIMSSCWGTPFGVLQWGADGTGGRRSAPTAAVTERRYLRHLAMRSELCLTIDAIEIDWHDLRVDPPRADMGLVRLVR